MTDPTYQESLAAYTSQLRGLFAPVPGAAPAPARRGGARIEAETLAGRADQLAGIALTLGQQHGAFLTSDQPGIILAAELKLLAQAEAEFKVASVLLQCAEDEMRGAKTGTRRSGSTTAIALIELANVLDAPLEQGLEPFLVKKVHRGGKSTSQSKACQALKDQARRSLNSISKNSANTSSVALNTLFSLDSKLLEKGISLVSKEMAEKLEKICADLSATVKKLINGAVRLMLQAYDWVLSLIGKDVEQTARKKIEEWIDALRAEHKNKDDVPGLASQLIERIFTTEQIMAQVNTWVDQSKKKTAELAKTSEDLSRLSEGFQLKVKRVQGTITTIGTVRQFVRIGSVKFPPLAAVLPHLELLSAAIIVSMMGYVIFTGYDHVDTGAATFMKRFSVKIPDRVQGVRKTV